MRIQLLPVPVLCLAIFLLPSYAASQPSPSVGARLASCDETTMRTAVDEMLRDPKTLQEPLMLFHAASAVRMSGRKEEATFLYLAGRLRASRQILFEKGDRPQLLAIMQMTVGPLVMPSLVSDPEMARRVVKRVVEWDRAMPDPYREREAAKTAEMQAKLAEIDAGLALADEMLATSPHGLRLSKQALNLNIDAQSLDAAMAIEDRQQVGEGIRQKADVVADELRGRVDFMRDPRRQLPDGFELLGLHQIVLDFGAKIPAGVPVGSASRLAVAPHPLDSTLFMELKLVLYVWE